LSAQRIKQRIDLEILHARVVDAVAVVEPPERLLQVAPVRIALRGLVRGGLGGHGSQRIEGRFRIRGAVQFAVGDCEAGAIAPFEWRDLAIRARA
jgi:hypothetical protein